MENQINKLTDRQTERQCMQAQTLIDKKSLITIEFFSFWQENIRDQHTVHTAVGAVRGQGLLVVVITVSCQCIDHGRKRWIVLKIDGRGLVGAEEQHLDLNQEYTQFQKFNGETTVNVMYLEFLNWSWKFKRSLWEIPPKKTWFCEHLDLTLFLSVS